MFDNYQATTMCERAPISLLTLPIELVYRILDKVNDLTLTCSTRNVCSRLNGVIDTYHQYQVKPIFNLSSMLTDHYFDLL